MIYPPTSEETFSIGEEVLAKCGDAFYRSIVISIMSSDLYEVRLIDHNRVQKVSKANYQIKKFGSTAPPVPIPDKSPKQWNNFTADSTSFFQNNATKQSGTTPLKSHLFRSPRLFKTSPRPLYNGIRNGKPSPIMTMANVSPGILNSPGMLASPSLIAIKDNLDQIMGDCFDSYERAPSATPRNFPLTPGNNKGFTSFFFPPVPSPLLSDRIQNPGNISPTMKDPYTAVSMEPLLNESRPYSMAPSHRHFFPKAAAASFPRASYSHFFCANTVPTQDRSPDRISPTRPSSTSSAAAVATDALNSYHDIPTWTGRLPPKNNIDTKYSRKVFLGGVPWDITNDDLQKKFNEFGSLQIEWPPTKNGQKPKGFVYIVFDEHCSVNRLLEHCCWSARYFRHHIDDGTVFKSHVRSGKMPNKEIQVVPWNINDSTKVNGPQDKVNMKNQVFIGGLHGMFTATFISKVMNDIFGNVVYVEIDTDKYKYPLGSGRVNFSSDYSYKQAIQAKYVKILCQVQKIEKRIQIDPYIRENECCSLCTSREGRRDSPGPIDYCRACLEYFCNECFNRHALRLQGKHERVTRQRHGK
eukprot:sb/3463340/